MFINFLYIENHSRDSMFDRFKKNLEKFRQEETREPDYNEPYGDSQIESGGVAEAERPQTESPQPEQLVESTTEANPSDIKSTEQTELTPPPQVGTEIGIQALMDKRVKLEQTIDDVGLMIKNLKDKRTKLEKEVEDESVDIKNLKEKLVKVNEYIDEENQGIKNLTQKRSIVEKEADEAGSIINNLRGKLSSLDQIVDEEGGRIKNFKESRSKKESTFS